MQEQNVNAPDTSKSQQENIPQEDSSDKKPKKKRIFIKVLIGTVLIVLMFITYYLSGTAKYSSETGPAYTEKVSSEDSINVIRESEFCKHSGIVTITGIDHSNGISVVDCYPPDWHSPEPMQTIVGVLIENMSGLETEVFMFKDRFYKAYLSKEEGVVLEKEIWQKAPQNYFSDVFKDSYIFTTEITEQLYEDKSNCFIGDGTCAQFQRKRFINLILLLKNQYF